MFLGVENTNFHVGRPESLQFLSKYQFWVIFGKKQYFVIFFQVFILTTPKLCKIIKNMK